MISPTQNNNSTALTELGLKPAVQQSKDSLDQKDFLTLLVAQLKNQNPTDPQDGAEFLGQMAQFGTLDSVQKMSYSMDMLANTLQSQQALQALPIVGKYVAVESNTVIKNEDSPLKAQIDVKHFANDVKVSVKNANGSLVKEFDLGPQSSGKFNFTWDGMDNGEQQLPEGKYIIEANGFMDGKRMALPVESIAKVQGIVIDGRHQIMADIQGVGMRKLDTINNIQDN